MSLESSAFFSQTEKRNIAHYSVYYAFNIYFQRMAFPSFRRYLGCALINELRRERSVVRSGTGGISCKVEASFSYCFCNSFPPCFSPIALSPFLLVALIV